MPHRIEHDLCSYSFMTIKFFVFQVEAFQFSKFSENMVKLDKSNFKRGLVKINCWNNFLTFQMPNFAVLFSPEISIDKMIKFLKIATSLVKLVFLI